MHIETSGVIPVCYKKFLDVLKVVTNNICFYNMVFLSSVAKTNAKEQALLLDQDRGNL